MKEKVINLIQKFDYIGKRFNFRYKSHENYRSLPGGIIYIGFLLMVLGYSMISLSYFIRKINKSIINYDTIISPTDKLNFLDYSFSLGFSITCNNYNEEINYPLYSLFDITFNYVYRIKNNKSVKQNIDLHLCNFSDFNSNLLEVSQIHQYIDTNIYYCPDHLNETITGIYEDDYFSYYEFTIKAKSLDNFTVYYNLLTNYDCKSHFFSSHVAFDLQNYSSPIKVFLSDFFLQINPLAYAKRNVFFKLDDFQVQDNFFFSKENEKKYMDYSRYDDYLLYKPKERFEENILDNINFVTIYFRADNERKFISRKYKTFPEYSSEVYTGLSEIYIILFLFTSFINSFYANHSIMQEFFQFKKTGKNSNEVFSKLKVRMSGSRIQRLSRMSKIAEFGSFAPGELENHSLLLKIKERKNSTSEFKNKYYLSNFSGPDNLSFKIRRKNSLNKNNSSDNISFNNSNNRMITKGKKNYNNSTASSGDSGKKRLSLFNYDKEKINFPYKEMCSCFSPSRLNRNLKKNNSKYSDTFTNMINNNQNITNKKGHKKHKRINLNYSILEIIISMFCPYCSSSKLQTKNKLLEKAKDKLFFGLDILTYLRNLQRTEYLNFILLEPYQNVLIGYMTKPSISLDYQFDVFEHLKNKYNPDFTGKEVEDFLRYYNQLTEIKNKSSVDTRLFNIVNIELENLCIE